jgi:hypothetical protein
MHDLIELLQMLGLATHGELSGGVHTVSSSLLHAAPPQQL